MGERKRRSSAIPRLLEQAAELRSSGMLAEALSAYQAAASLMPDNAQTWVAIGELSLQLRKLPDALAAFTAALAHQTDLVPALAGKAQVLEALGRTAEASVTLATLCAAVPGDSLLHERLGIARQTIGDLKGAESAYRSAISLSDHSRVKAKLATLVSPIAKSVEGIFEERQRLITELDRLLELPPILDSDPIRDALWPNFYLAFQGLCNRELHIKYAAAYSHLYPHLSHVASHCSSPRRTSARLRVGFISRYFFNHSISRTSRGVIAQLPRERTEVIAIFVGTPPSDEYAQFIAQHADRYIFVPLDLTAARRAISELELDVLYYQDIGMDPFTYFLAFSRLAPVQSVSFGHPDTTGIPAMDYFITSELFEPSDGDSHYSESAYRLRNIGTLAYYYRPTLQRARKTRQHLGYTDRDHLYLCPQNLFKIHPDMDEAFRSILERDANGLLLLIKGHHPLWTSALINRWQSWPPELIGRVRFLDRLSSPDFLNLIAVADVVLDTFHFNGMNTSLESFAVSTPVVSLPGRLQRGRHTYGMYQRMEINDCIASTPSEYVELALRVAKDSDFRSTITTLLEERCSVLFEDLRVVEQFDDFFYQVTKPGAAAS